MSHIVAAHPYPPVSAGGNAQDTAASYFDTQTNTIPTRLGKYSNNS